MEENKLPEKIFAVEYAGFWDLSPTDSYDLSVLHVLDYPNAEQIANEIAKRYNESASLKAENDRLREALRESCDVLNWHLDNSQPALKIYQEDFFNLTANAVTIANKALSQPKEKK